MDWKDIVGKFAPTIGAALGGPLGGAATSVLLDKFGIAPSEPDAEAQLEAAVKRASPEQLAELKRIDNGFKIKLKELDIETEAVHAADRDSARQREAKVGGYANPLLAATVIVGFFATVGFVLTQGLNGVSTESGMLIGSLVGYVSAKADQVVSYYFGSSSSSAQKTELLTKRGN